jgi:FkbM family methyltransferase
VLTTKAKIRIARFVQRIVMGVRSVAGLTAAPQVRRQGVTWQLDLREGIDFSIWLLGSFEPGTVRTYRKVIQPGDTVLDIGANIGAHTLHLAECVGPSGRVLAFEPTDYAFEKLVRNTSLNPGLAPRIQCCQFMLVAEQKETATTVPLYSSWPLEQNDAAKHNLHEGRLMPTTGARPRTLDAAVAALNLNRLDCIKLDIDGFECQMFRGARETLTRWHPTIIMELAPYVLEEQGGSLAELVELLGDYGYALYHTDSGEPLAMDAAKLLQLIPHGASLNVLARAPLRREAVKSEAGEVAV